MREPFTEPYTLRERALIRRDLARDALYRFRRDGIWRWIAWHLPRRAVLWCFIRVAANVTDLPPDQITYPVAYDRWERPKEA